MNWKRALKDNIATVGELKRQFEMTEEQEQKVSQVVEKFPMSIPHYYLSLIDKGDKNDPIRRMCVPSGYEEDLSGSFDTSGEYDNTVIDGLQHKYKQTALILSTSNCAMYCRHCFRKRLVGVSDDEVAKNIGLMTDYIKEHKEINNVLISGGDSFMLNNQRIEDYLRILTEIEHIDFIRFGTRTPVVLPERITGDPELLEILQRYGEKKQIIVATQFNHRRELTRDAREAVGALLRRNIPVLNQAVLLKGVNDSEKELGLLLKELTAAGIKPYYVFQCRPVKGVKSHFQVPFKKAYQIVEGAKAMQNGIGKSFRYCLSHVTGKIEILGIEGDRLYLKYHEAKDEKDYGRIFAYKIGEDTSWIEDDFVLN